MGFECLLCSEYYFLGSHHISYIIYLDVHVGKKGTF